ncbi:MAG: bifunctional 3,4-dihydroxy-2-butanone-4-phosphate synthase/GTP cyclohydrolase II [Thermaerobacterales bacterium]
MNHKHNHHENRVAAGPRTTGGTEGTGAVFAAIEEAIECMRAGEMIVVVDDEDRENEGDLLMAAEKVTPEAINFMVTHGRGLICTPMTGERLQELGIPLMVDHPGDAKETAFTISVDAREAVTTGISAHDRARTVRLLADPASAPSDLAQPGHVFPLQARPGGVLRRPGHTEAAVDLARLAGLQPAGVICEIMNSDGTMARVPDLIPFAQRHRLKMISIADLVAYRMHREQLVTRLAETTLPTRHGNFHLVAYAEVLTGKTIPALILGEVHSDQPILVRMHSECLTGDVFGSRRCDCGEQLDLAMQRIQEEGRGIIVYLRQEGRGIGLARKVEAYALQDQGMDTVEANLKLGFQADARDFGTGAQILADLGARQIRLLTNNPRKFQGLSGYGLELVERVALKVEPNPSNRLYLETKRTKLGHLL